MAITITRRETTLNEGGVPAGTTLANHTFSVDIGDIIINDTEDKTLNNYATTPTSGTIKYDNSSGGRGLISDTFDLRFYIEGNYIRRARYQSEESITGRGYPLSANVLGTIARKSYWWDTDHTVSDYFNSSNKTSPTVEVDYRLHHCFLQTRPAVLAAYGDVGYATYNDTTTDIGSIKLRLNVPPTFDNTSLSFDTSSPYTNVTTASVTISNSAAYYGGDVVSSALTIGSQTVTGTGDGTLSILLDTAGTFTPTVSVTDSRGQVTTKTLDPIEVKGYTAPAVTFTADRTLQTGVEDDEGGYATVDATFTYTDVVADLVAPSVVLTDENGTQTTPTVTWYKTRATDGTLSSPFTDWTTVAYGDTVYGLIPGLSTQYSYQVSIRPRDTQGTGTAIVQTIAPAFYTIDFLAGGHGIAFGKPASNVGFECAMAASFIDANGTMRALFDFIYPVGSYYETSDTTFDPNITWGGTWALEAEGLVHIGAGSNYSIGDVGGEETHTLTVDEMPNHSHKVRYTGRAANGIYGGMAGTSVDANPYYNNLLVANEGGGQAHNNMQPYIVVNRWHRTA